MILLVSLIALVLANTGDFSVTRYLERDSVRNIKMTAFSVKNVHELASAMRSARGGDTISLAAGEYGAVVINGQNFASGVTLKSASSTQAHFDSLRVKNSSNITFKGIDIGGADNATNATFKGFISGSDHLVFDGVRVHGTMDGNAQNDGSGLRILNSENITIKNSEFEQLLRGVMFERTSNITFASNYVHDIRMDGSAFAQVKNVVIDSNRFTNFDRKPEDHSDAIQFWTTNTDEASTDIKITNNQILQGSGTAMQGIFMRDEKGGLRYQRVTIENNLLYESGYTNGITVANADKVKILGNTAISSSQIAGATKIRVSGVSGAQIHNNVTDQFAWMQNNKGINTEGNITFSSSPGKTKLLRDITAADKASVRGLIMPKAGYQLRGSVPSGDPAPSPVTNNSDAESSDSAFAPSTLSDSLAALEPSVTIFESTALVQSQGVVATAPSNNLLSFFSQFHASSQGA